MTTESVRPDPEDYALDGEVRVWATEHESGAGEEYERTWYPTEYDPAIGDPDGTIQLWAESPIDVTNGQVVGMWISGPTQAHGVRSEIRVNVTPAQALELAANLIIIVGMAEDKAEWAAEEAHTDLDRGGR